VGQTNVCPTLTGRAGHAQNAPDTRLPENEPVFANSFTGSFGCGRYAQLRGYVFCKF
jgi:hypothetical protein